MQELVALWKEIAAIKSQLERTFVEGTVHEVDPKAQTARLKIAEDDDGKPVLGPPVPYAQWAGALKGHTPVSVGQQMTMIAPGGNWRRATLVPMTFSDQNKSPSEKGDENVFTYGDFTITLKGKSLVVDCGGKNSFTLDDKGAKIKIDGVEHEWTKDEIKQTVGGVKRKLTGSGSEQDGGKVKHEGKNIGSDHLHAGVTPGGGKSAGPEA